MAQIEKWERRADDIGREFEAAAHRLGEEARQRFRALRPMPTRSMLAWAVITGLSFGTGFLLGLLTAPRRGDETRHIVRDRAAEYSKDISGRISGRLSRVK